MEPYVIIATKGRPAVVRELLDWIASQTLQPNKVVVVGSTSDDIAGLDTHRLNERGLLHFCLSCPGLCLQRNAGLGFVWSARSQGSAPSEYFVAFFDDDFRPHPRWLELCRLAFLERSDVVGLTGRVLADGILGSAISESAAQAYVHGTRPPAKASRAARRVEIDTLYGCNMAFRDRIVAAQRFDENLPLYGWQEDQDYSVRARGCGRLLYEPACTGVHLGVKGGRVSGRKFGYSQIANPWYLSRKGTLSLRRGLRLASRNLAANLVKSVWRREVDYPGRLKGNLLALGDLVRGRVHPMRVADL